ncbi:hypothetical protein BH18CHL2_BH18CHL2_02700 [soil metagenome]
MSETAVFPLPVDASEEEREAARSQIAKHTAVHEVGPSSIAFEGRAIGQTGPVWHLQYTRLYALPTGYLVAAHDLREGIVVRYAGTPEKLAESFEQPAVREFIDDELRFRGITGTGDAAAV